MDIKEKQYFATLYGIYHSVLPEKMIEYLNSFLIDDLSVSEISENAAVSRQAISTQIKRGIDELEKYESKLNIYRSYTERKGIEDKIIKTNDLSLMSELIEIEEK